MDDDCRHLEAFGPDLQPDNLPGVERVQFKLVEEVDDNFLSLRGETHQHSGQECEGLQDSEQRGPILQAGGLAGLSQLGPLGCGDGEARHEHSVLLVDRVVRQTEPGAEAVRLALVQSDVVAQ